MNRLLIGDNAFIGVSHLSQSHAREKIAKLDVETIVEVIEEAILCGASGFTFSTHPNNFEILRALADAAPRSSGFELYPVLPYAEGYVRLTNERGTIGLLREILSKLRLSAKTQALIKGGISAIRLDPFGMLGAYVDMELASYLSIKPENARVEAVLLHEVVTDLGISFHTRSLFDYFMEHIRDSYHVKPGFVTRNFVLFAKFFDNEGLSLKDVMIMTPFNRAGFQMNPSRESCETCLSHLSGGNVLAMSIMAGGYLNLDDAVQYLGTLPELSGAVAGVSSKQHARETFSKLGALRQR